MIQVIEYRPVNKKSLLGNFDIIIPKWGGFIIRDMSYFKKENQRWVSLPSKAFEVDGKRKYKPLCVFHSPSVNKLFINKIIESLDAFFLEQKIEQ